MGKEVNAPTQAASRFHVTKLDAARRQLRVAISLWFQDGDAIAVHTLACAAHQIIHDINRKKGGPDLVFDSSIVTEEHRKEMVMRLKQAMNFFKHADVDPDGVVEFVPEISELFIMGSLWGLECFGLRLNPIEAAFSHWYMIKHPDVLTEKGRRQRAHLAQIGSLRVLEEFSPRRFFLDFMRAASLLDHIR